jgi:hypothetical protein
MVDLVPGTNVVAQREALVDRLFGATLAAMDLFSVYLGDRLGYYQALVAGGPATSAELAARTGTHERCVREWLEQQAVTGILEAENPEADASVRRFRLPAGHIEPLTDPDSLMTMTPLARCLASCAAVLPQLLEAFRTGGGVPFADYGVDLHEGQAGSTRPLFLHLLTQEWLPAMPDVHSLLQTKADARVADIGWDTVGRALPSSAPTPTSTSTASTSTPPRSRPPAPTPNRPASPTA